MVRDEEQFVEDSGGSGGLQLTLAGDHIAASSVVRVLGGVADVRHVYGQTPAAVSAKCFFQLWQLRRIRRSLDDNAVATLVHAFVASRVDYCGIVYSSAHRRKRRKVTAGPQRCSASGVEHSQV